MTSQPTLLCVHPHPDDESISCGGVLARAHDLGVRTVVVTCTGGEAGENLAGIDLGGEDLVAHRERELRDALAVLDVDAHHLLGYRDSGMADTPDNDRPDSFHRADLDEAALRLAAILRRERPHVVASDDANGSYGHPDHVKANQVTVRAVMLAADPGAPLDGTPWRVAKRYVHALGRGRLLLMHNRLVEAGLASPFGDEDYDAVADVAFGVADELVTTEVDVRDWWPRKRDAMASHRSQIGADSFFLNLPDELAAEVFGVEQFVLEDGVLGTEHPPERDLFQGLPGGSAGDRGDGVVPDRR